MRFSLDRGYRDFFLDNGYIEFEDLFSIKDIEIIDEVSDQIVMKRMGLTPTDFRRESPQNKNKYARDIWRDSKEVKRIVCRSSTAEIAGELIHKRPLRLAYDQLFDYQNFPEGKTLNEVTALQGLLCAWIICIESPSEKDPDAEKGILPIERSSAIFINADHPLSFADSPPFGRYFVIAYAQDRAIYLFNEDDPHAHYLKTLNYNYGDSLRHQTHPVIYR